MKYEMLDSELMRGQAETIMGESDFGTFMSKQEGQGAENDNVETTFKKTIEHIEFAKEFTITRKMADDAKFGMGADMKNKPRKFVRAYYRTRVEIAAQALIHGCEKTMKYNKADVDLTSADGLSLFNKSHPFSTDKMKGKTQSNYFWGKITESAGALEEALGELANKVRNFKDENGKVIPAYAAYTRYDVKKLVSDFMALCCPPIKEEEENTLLNQEYEQEGDSIILLPYDKRGVYKVLYEHRPTAIENTGATTEDTQELDLDEELCSLMPLLVAAYVWIEDEPEKSEYYMGLYRERVQEIVVSHKNTAPVLIKSTNGW